MLKRLGMTTICESKCSFTLLIQILHVLEPASSHNSMFMANESVSWRMLDLGPVSSDECKVPKHKT